MAYCCAGQHKNEAGALWCSQCGSLVAGAMIGDYRVFSFVGKGSTAEVYLAEQPALMKRKVVIKILPQALSDAGVETFQREASVLASLSHPYILPIYAYGLLYRTGDYGPELGEDQPEQRPQQTRCLPYLVLPYAERGSLADIFAREGRRPWSLNRVVTIAREIADALDYAHSKGILHRDVKPANILYMGTHALLSDFSVATLIEADVSHLTAPWAGSPAYMAPEVWQLRPGRYSDQYALAVACFYLLTGDLPLRKKEGPQSRSWAHLHSFGPPRSILERRPDLPIAVDLVLQRALAKNPHERYATVTAFAADLLTAAQDITQNLVTLIDTREIGSRARGKAGNEEKAPEKTAAPPPHAKAVLGGPVTGQAVPVTPVVRPLEGPTPDTSPVDLAEARPGPPQSWTHQAKMHPLMEVDTESFASAEERSRWVFYAFLLNFVICLALAGESWWQYNNLSIAADFLLAVWPAMLVAPLLGRLFRRVVFTSLSWGLFWGTFFGLTNGLLSVLACLVWIELLHLAINFHCGPWCKPGDGITIAVQEIASIAPFAIVPFVAGLWISVIGGALIGILNIRNE